MDDDDKIRRNLVVASSVIIAVAWFGVPLPDLVERLFSLKSSAGTLVLADWRVWAAVLVVLAYLALRYRWSNEVEAGIAAHDKAAKARYILIYSRDYLPTVSHWIKAGRVPDSAGALKQLLDPIFQSSLTRKFGPPKQVDWQKLDPRGIAPAPTDGNTGIPVDLTWTVDDGAEHVEKQVFNLPIDVKRQRRYWLRARLYAHVYSQGAMALLFPGAIASVAAAITLWKLGWSIAAALA